MMNQDFLDLLAAFLAEQVEFIVVGAHAMAVHSVPRATGDLDVWVRPEASNARRVWRALASFGAPLEALGFEAENLEEAGTVWQIGMPPKRIDILTAIDGLEFEDAAVSCVHREMGGLRIPFLGLEALRVNKAATGRPKDRLDLELLREVSRDEVG